MSLADIQSVGTDLVQGFIAIGKDFESAVVNPSNIQDPGKLSSACKISKILIISLAIASLAIGLFGSMLAVAFLLLVTHDNYKILDNIDNVATQRCKDAIVRANPLEIVAGTFLAKPIIELFS